MSIKDSRREYQYSTLARESLLENPFDQFRLWMEQAIDDDIVDPTAMSVATVNSDGKPWQRMVLLKGFDELGFVFYTNLNSQKGNELKDNPNATMCFHWKSLLRQIRITGTLKLVDNKTADDYYNTRGYESRIGAWASKQSGRRVSGKKTGEYNFWSVVSLIVDAMQGEKESLDEGFLDVMKKKVKSIAVKVDEKIKYENTSMKF